jgi:hypothetical protein
VTCLAIKITNLQARFIAGEVATIIVTQLSFVDRITEFVCQAFNTIVGHHFFKGVAVDGF